MMNNEFKELEKLEKCAESISNTLQKHYDVDPSIADELTLFFLSNNFHATKEHKIGKMVRFTRALSSARKSIKLWWRYETFFHVVGAILGIAILAGGIIYGIVYLNRTYGSKLPYTGVVAESYRFCGRYSCERVIKNSNIVLPIDSEASFDTQMETLEDGQTAEMMGNNGHGITMTKKNHQVIFVEHE